MVARCLRYSIYRSPVRQCDAVFRPSHHGSRWIRKAATSSAPPSKRSRVGWLRVAVVTVAAGGIGAFIRSEQNSHDTTLNPITFTQYELVSKTPISSTNSVFSFRPVKQGQGNDKVYQDAWNCGVWSVQFKQPQLQVGRDYTPLPPASPPLLKQDDDGNSKEATPDEADETLRFLIRRDPYGEVSGYLHGLKIGSIVEMRGPQIEFDISRDVDEILFIAGGTGIAPALQAAHNIFDRRELQDNTRLHILWANRRREDCTGGQNDLAIPSTADGKWWSKLLPAAAAAAQQSDPRPDDEIQGWTVKQLEELKKSHPGQFTVDYFVDEEKTLVTKESIIRFINSTARTQHDNPSRRKKLILISGPEGFISYLAGPKLWIDGYEAQGPLVGILRELNLTDWIIWKL